jgi:hypothetical protein
MMTLTPEKFIAKSKTFQGLVVMAIPMLASLVGFEWAGDDNAAVNQTIDALITFVGFAWGLFGRLTAKAPVRMTP